MQSVPPCLMVGVQAHQADRVLRPPFLRRAAGRHHAPAQRQAAARALQLHRDRAAGQPHPQHRAHPPPRPGHGRQQPRLGACCRQRRGGHGSRPDANPSAGRQQASGGDSSCRDTAHHHNRRTTIETPPPPPCLPFPLAGRRQPPPLSLVNRVMNGLDGRTVVAERRRGDDGDGWLGVEDDKEEEGTRGASRSCSSLLGGQGRQAESGGWSRVVGLSALERLVVVVRREGGRRRPAGHHPAMLRPRARRAHQPHTQTHTLI